MGKPLPRLTIGSSGMDASEVYETKRRCIITNRHKEEGRDGLQGQSESFPGDGAENTTWEFKAIGIDSLWKCTPELPTFACSSPRYFRCQSHTNIRTRKVSTWYKGFTAVGGEKKANAYGQPWFRNAINY